MCIPHLYTVHPIFILCVVCIPHLCTVCRVYTTSLLYVVYCMLGIPSLCTSCVYSKGGMYTQRVCTQRWGVHTPSLLYVACCVYIISVYMLYVQFISTILYVVCISHLYCMLCVYPMSVYMSCVCYSTAEAMPGNIRNAEHFIGFMRQFIEYLKVCWERWVWLLTR